jgi:hypothetical protein
MPRRYLIGMLAGWALWLALAVVEFLYEQFRTSIPDSVEDATNFIYLCINIAVWPMELGGWMIWGDGNWPAWAGWPLNVALGLALWGTFGVITAAIYSRSREPR